MSRINTNVTSLVAQRVLNKNNSNLNQSLARLSTGLRINSGKDDPAGLIASENLRAEKTGISTAIDNASRADNILSTADGGLNEVSSLLNELQGLVGQAANTGGLSPEETAANQLQVDSILSTVNRISGSTNFQGTKLLNGNFDYTTSSVGTSAISNLRVNASRQIDSTTKSVVVQVVTSATTANLTYTSGTLSGSTVNLEISGKSGTEQIAFGSGTTIAQIATAVNSRTESTGVSAVSSGGTLYFNSTDYGTGAYVGVRALTGTFNVSGAKDYGTDAVVTVNGATAEVDGLKASYRSADLDVEFDINSTINVAGTAKTFGITGGGATFSIGSKVTEDGKASLGIASVSTGSLGDSALGFLSTLGSGGTNSLGSGNLVNAQKIIDKAIKQVSQARGRIGAFQKFTIGSTVNSLGIALENANAAESAIRDTDFASETANMTRSQILSQAASTVLAQANSSPQSVLSLLR
jgi:flagellin